MTNFSGPGTLIIKPLQAQLMRDTEIIGAMDPYVIFSLGGNKVKTGVCKNGGKTPFWSDTLILTRNAEDTLFVEVWDDESFRKDQYIASASIPLSQLSIFSGSTSCMRTSLQEKYS